MTDELRSALAQPTVDVVLAGRMLGVGRSAAYRAVRDGSLPSFKIGSQYRVPTTRLREMLGLPVQEPKAA